MIVLTAQEGYCITEHRRGERATSISLSVEGGGRWSGQIYWRAINRMNMVTLWVEGNGDKDRIRIRTRRVHLLDHERHRANAVHKELYKELVEMLRVYAHMGV